jgi:hypothetical protein
MDLTDTIFNATIVGYILFSSSCDFLENVFWAIKQDLANKKLK